MKEELSVQQKQKYLIISMCMQLIAGISFSLVVKWQNETPGERGFNFDHAYFQSFFLSVGKSLALIVYAVKKVIYKDEGAVAADIQAINSDRNEDDLLEVAQPQVLKKPIDKKLFAIPAFLDLMENCLKNTSQTMISQSVVSMMRSTIFLFCALGALKFLKKRLYKHHWISMAGIMSGVALVGIGYLTTQDTDTKTYSQSDIIIGLVMVQISQIFGAAAFVTEEKFMGDHEKLDPLLLLGYEGIFGGMIWLVVLPILNYIPCDNKAMCQNEYKVVESIPSVFRDFEANGLLIIQSVILTLSLCVLFIGGISITKYGSSAQRTTCDMLRNLFIWIFLLNVPLGGRKETFTVFQLIGFLILTFGVFVYNELIVIKYWGMDDNTKLKIEQRKLQQQ